MTTIHTPATVTPATLTKANALATRLVALCEEQRVANNNAEEAFSFGWSVEGHKHGWWDNRAATLNKRAGVLAERITNLLGTDNWVLR